MKKHALTFLSCAGILTAMHGIDGCTKTNYLATFPVGHAVQVKGNTGNFETGDWISDSGMPFKYPAYVRSRDSLRSTSYINSYIIRANDSTDWYMNVSNLKDLGPRK